MIVNGVTLAAGMAGLVLACVLTYLVTRPSSASLARRQAMRAGTHPAGKRHVTQAMPPAVPPHPALALARTWTRLADAEVGAAFRWHEAGHEAAAHEAFMRAQRYRANATRCEHEARTELATGGTVDLYV